MSFNLWESYNYPDEASADPPYVQIEPSHSSSAANENVHVLNVTQQASNVEEVVSYAKHIGAERKCTELLEELASYDNPLNAETIAVAIKKVSARKRKNKRGRKVYKCPYCDYVCTPGGRDNMLHHLNGYSRYGHYFKPCKDRMKARPAVNGIFEKLEPIDITDQQPKNLDSGNSSSQY